MLSLSKVIQFPRRSGCLSLPRTAGFNPQPPEGGAPAPFALERELGIGKFDIGDCRSATCGRSCVHPLDGRIATGKSLGTGT